MEPIRGYTVDVWKSDHGLPQNTASSLAQSPDGFPWIGTQAGLARFNGSAFEVLTRQNSPGLIDSEVRHLLTTHDGSIWMSTGGGLCRMSSGKVVGQDSATGLLLSDAVLSEDHQGQIYAGNRSGLFLWQKGWNFSPVAALPDKHVRAMAEDNTGRIWVATDKGVCELRGLQCFADSAPRSTQGLETTALYADRQGGLWLGGAGHVWYWNDNTIHRFTASDGVPNATVTAIIGDDHGVCQRRNKTAAFRPVL
ncbi:MAG: two-component regulator propeller domain-containing protein [Candidatus Sulfopaludibacter sp.]|nr:two-component regulator propeller domain-containing protein [Candidatus Sulfopaludibacter sp.]